MKCPIAIPYADGEKRFEVDQDRLAFCAAPVLPPRPSPADEQETVRRAISAPIGGRRLDQLAGAARTVAVLVDDFTRPTPAYKILPVVLQELADGGIADDNVRIVIARGMHRRLSPADMSRKVGKDVLARYEVRNHENDRDLVYLGESPRGTPVWINRTVVEADARVAIGSVCAHPVAGYGGGAKIIVPGVAGHETIHVNHSRCDHPSVTIGRIDGNPIREDMNDIARIARLDSMVNTILNPDREIIAAVAGDVVDAHREGVSLYNRLYGFPVSQLADLVVVGASPRDATFGHATFALYAGASMTKAGGVMVLVAPCTEGPDSQQGRTRFRELAERPLDELMALMRQGKVSASGGAFDYAYVRSVREKEVILVSDSFSASEAADLGVGHADSVQQAVDRCLGGMSAEARLGVLPVGGLTVPVSG
jgi:nickel-dependent lactate racemase